MAEDDVAAAAAAREGLSKRSTPRDSDGDCWEEVDSGDLIAAEMEQFREWSDDKCGIGHCSIDAGFETTGPDNQRLDFKLQTERITVDFGGEKKEEEWLAAIRSQQLYLSRR